MRHHAARQTRAVRLPKHRSDWGGDVLSPPFPIRYIPLIRVPCRCLALLPFICGIGPPEAGKRQSADPAVPRGCFSCPIRGYLCPSYAGPCPKSFTGCLFRTSASIHVSACSPWQPFLTFFAIMPQLLGFGAFRARRAVPFRAEAVPAYSVLLWRLSGLLVFCGVGVSRCSLKPCACSLSAFRSSVCICVNLCLLSFPARGALENHVPRSAHTGRRPPKRAMAREGGTRGLRITRMMPHSPGSLVRQPADGMRG